MTRTEEWRRNLTHVEWLIDHLELYEFPEEFAGLGEDLRLHTQGKYTYYFRAAEEYETFLEHFYQNPLKYQHGLLDDREGCILSRDIRGYFVEIDGIFFPLGFLWEQGGYERQISQAFKNWKMQVLGEYEGLETYVKDWIDQMEEGERRIRQAKPGELASRFRGVACLLIYGMAGSVLFSFLDRYQAKIQGALPGKAALYLLAAAVIWGLMVSLRELYLAEKIGIYQERLAEVNELWQLLKLEKQRAFGAAEEMFLEEPLLEESEGVELAKKILKSVRLRLVLGERRLSAMRGKFSAAAAFVAWLGVQVFYCFCIV